MTSLSRLRIRRGKWLDTLLYKRGDESASFTAVCTHPACSCGMHIFGRKATATAVVGLELLEHVRAFDARDDTLHPNDAVTGKRVSSRITHWWH